MEGKRYALENLRKWLEDQLSKPAKLSTNQYQDLVAQLIQVEQAETLEEILANLEQITETMQDQSIFLGRIATALERASKRMEDNP